MTPDECMRPSVQIARCVAVTCKSGTILYVRPCLIKPNDILAESLNNYQLLVLELRNAWAKAELMHAAIEVGTEIWGQVALMAIQENYDASRATINSWMANEGEEVALVDVAAIACGYLRNNKTLADQRRRALGAAMVGMGDTSLTATEIAAVSDFSINTKQSPF